MSPKRGVLIDLAAARRVRARRALPAPGRIMAAWIEGDEAVLKFEHGISYRLSAEDVRAWRDGFDSLLSRLPPSGRPWWQK